MTTEEERFEFMLEWLQQEWVPFEVIHGLFGIERQDERLWGSFGAWAAHDRRSREVLRPDRVSRHAFETYLQRSGLLPRKVAGARLGMSEASFEDVLERLIEQGAHNESNVSPQLVPETVVRRMGDHFPGLRHTIFPDHDSFCQQLHAEIQKDLGFTVTPMHCVTSRAVDPNTPDFAYSFDCLNGEPIGLRFQVWLDFRKPMYLRPDACSLKLYAKQEDLLRPFVFAGRQPEIPKQLRV